MARGWLAIGMLALSAQAGCIASTPTSSPATALTPEQRAQALKRASAYCRKKGMVMRVDRSEPRPRAKPATSELQFRCVKAG